MIVSFDLDDTLYVSPDNFKTEKEPGFPFKFFYKERLRLGTKELFERLQADGFETWIYTTSFRSEGYIRGLFRRYGIKVGQVINGSRHMKEVQGNKTEPMPSKYPGKYRIGLHVDDDISVLQNGKTYGFKVFLIGPQDDEWVEKVINEARRIRDLNSKKEV
ncbi:MAG: HAD family hydrolase [Lachnospiraceae bacterium]|nr:HAD family hydrolase [Lachnospiraceae bacterium]